MIRRILARLEVRLVAIHAARVARDRRRDTWSHGTAAVTTKRRAK